MSVKALRPGGVARAVVTAPGVCYPSESGVTSGVRGGRPVRHVRARVRLNLPRTSVVPCPLGNPRWRMVVSLPLQVPLPGGGARDVLARECLGRDEVIASAGVLPARYGPLSTAAAASEDPADLVPSGPLAGRATRPRLGPAVLRNRLVTCRHCRGRQRPLRPARLGGRRNLAMPGRIAASCRSDSGMTA
jgi:hypothetical protein